MGRVVGAATALVAVLVVSSPRARADNELDHPIDYALVRPPIVLEGLVVSLTRPLLTVGARSGVHGWLADRWRLEAHGEVWIALGSADLDGDGQDDFVLGDAASYDLAAEVAIGLPLWQARTRGYYYQRLGGAVDRFGRRTPLDEGGFARVDDLEAVVGAKLAIDGDWPLAVPIGLRLARRDYTDQSSTLRETWVEARALIFPVTQQLGVDAEVTWLPRTYGLGLFLAWFPRLAAGGRLDCVDGRDCTPDYPVSVFNLVPYDGMVQVGLRIHSDFPL